MGQRGSGGGKAWSDEWELALHKPIRRPHPGLQPMGCNTSKIFMVEENGSAIGPRRVCVYIEGILTQAYSLCMGPVRFPGADLHLIGMSVQHVTSSVGN